MEIVLVKPCWQYPISGNDHTYNRRWPPLDLLNTAAILQADGHGVRLIDAQAEDLSPERVADRLGSPDLTVVTSSALDRWQCPSLELAPLLGVTEALRGRGGKLLLSGFHGTVRPAAMLEMTGVDAVVRGEPERTVQDVAAGRAWSEIPGLTFPQQGRIVSNEDRPPLEMTSLPAPAFHLIDLKHYRYEILGPRLMVLEGSRGCPFACTFCSRAIQGKKVRRKTVEQLGREVEVATGQFGAKNIYFIDLEFTTSADFVRGICEYLLERRLRVRWCCQTRADQVDQPLLGLMRRAGCRLIHFGVESGSRRIAELTRKNIDPKQQAEAVRLARRAGIETLCFFLLGYPGETEAEMQQTIDLARRLRPTYASFHRVSPYPGSELFAQLPDDQDELFPAFAGTPQRQQQVDQMVRRAIRSFYLRPGYIAGRLLRSRPGSLWRQLKLFLGYFR